MKFISISETSGTGTYTTKKNADGEFITRDEEGYIIHPAFENGSKNGAKAQGHSDFVEYNNGEWDSELAGFWIAKYAASAEDASGTAIEPGNVEISTTVKLVSKPGVVCWRNIYAGNMYKNSYNYNRENESHMIKNSEWGATAYLAHSKYGRNGNEIVGNTMDYLTDNRGEIVSSTGNTYGVYDLNGCIEQRVAAWDTLSTSEYLLNFGNITIDGFSYAVAGESSNKYATAYENGTETTAGVLVKTVGKTGDGLKEIYINDNELWFADFSGFGNDVAPYFGRSHSWGIFYSYGLSRCK